MYRMFVKNWSRELSRSNTLFKAMKAPKVATEVSSSVGTMDTSMLDQMLNDLEKADTKKVIKSVTNLNNKLETKDSNFQNPEQNQLVQQQPLFAPNNNFQSGSNFQPINNQNQQFQGKFNSNYQKPPSGFQNNRPGFNKNQYVQNNNQNNQNFNSPYQNNQNYKKPYQGNQNYNKPYQNNQNYIPNFQNNQNTQPQNNEGSDDKFRNKQNFQNKFQKFDPAVPFIRKNAIPAAPEQEFNKYDYGKKYKDGAVPMVTAFAAALNNSSVKDQVLYSKDFEDMTVDLIKTTKQVLVSLSCNGSRVVVSPKCFNKLLEWNEQFQPYFVEK